MLDKLGIKGAELLNAEFIDNGEMLEIMICIDKYWASITLNKNSVLELADDLVKLAEKMK